MKQQKLINIKTTKASRRGSTKTQNNLHRCIMCGKPLTDSISISRGVGSECYEKYLKQKRKYTIFDKLNENSEGEINE